MDDRFYEVKGMEDYVKGRNQNSNPYHPKSDEGEKWIQGWRKARDYATLKKLFYGEWVL